tara:strand:+ start:78 stop:434 length:357 start_codon:yes stop_codon:yes gene_type:complete
MLDLDLKSVAVGVVISVAAGGGLYGLYVKTAGEAGMAQANAYGLIGECATLMSSSNADEIREFIARSNESLPDIQKSDAVVTAVSAAATDSTRVAGLGTPLSMCLQGLESHLKRVDRG